MEHTKDLESHVREHYLSSINAWLLHYVTPSCGEPIARTAQQAITSRVPSNSHSLGGAFLGAAPSLSKQNTPRFRVHQIIDIEECFHSFR